MYNIQSILFYTPNTVYSVQCIPYSIYIAIYIHVCHIIQSRSQKIATFLKNINRNRLILRIM